VTPEHEPAEMELRDYLRILRRRWLIIAVTVAILVVLAVGISLAETKIYEATAEVLVKPTPSQQVFSPNSNDQFDAQRAVDTELQVLQSRTVKQAVKKKLGREPDVSVNGVGQTDVIAVSARSPNPKRAAGDAKTYAETYVSTRRSQSVNDLLSAGREVQSKIDSLQRQLDALPANSSQRPTIEDQQAFYRRQLDQFQVAANVAQVGGGQVVTAPAVPSSPVRPTTTKNALIAAFFGLLLGIGLAYLREYLDDSVKTKDDLERATGNSHVLALIPAAAGWKDTSRPYLVTKDRPDSPAAEAYRTLRTSLQFLRLEEPIHSLQITSAATAEGKTTTLANLAVSLVQAGQRVFVVDFDLRRPRLHEFFGLSNRVGFTSVLLGESSLSKAIQPVPDEPALGVLASGPPPPDPSELLSLPATVEILDSLENRADIVLLDSPPVIPVSDPLVVSKYADATLLVSKAGATSKRSLRRATEILEQVGAPVVGSVLNDIHAKLGYEYAYSAYAYESSGRRRVGADLDKVEGNGSRRSKRSPARNRPAPRTPQHGASAPPQES
jgi:polysaccharide biosynthesis transport protein